MRGWGEAVQVGDCFRGQDAPLEERINAVVVVVSIVFDTVAGVGTLRWFSRDVIQLPIVRGMHSPELITVTSFDEGTDKSFKRRGAGDCVADDGDVCA